MNNKKTTISGVLIIIILLFLRDIKTAENLVKEENEKKEKLIKYDMFEGINQCVWGTWVITEVWLGNSLNEEDERINTVIKILPQSFSYGEKTSTELVGYPANLMAIKDNKSVFFEIDTFQNLGMNGDYYLMFYPWWDEYEKKIFPFVQGCVFISETEMLIPCAGHTRCMLEKIEDFDVAGSDISFMAEEHAFCSACYGTWIITEKLTKNNKELVNDSYIRQTVIFDRKSENFASCRVFGRSEKKIDELAVQIGIGSENKYLVCYDFPEDYFWNQMICVDDMTAVLVKGNDLFRVERISNAEKDRIYSVPY